MGREIRRVPKDWEHPTNENGNYKALYDQDYDSAAVEWMENLNLWQDGQHEYQQGKDSVEIKYYWEYAGHPLEEDNCRPAFTEEPTCYQIYETVSEGTPTSPVFESEADMKAWLIEQGHSKEAAEGFIQSGWAPSGIYMNGQFLTGIDAMGPLDASRPEKGKP